ncbi:MAG: glycosyltransferase [Candidatus Omnitrophica bacterium]|nr:glycosyltransferase [Candidatus Omnitrophota bacterium]
MMSKFRILYVENFSEIIGGGQISLLALLEKLDKELFNPIVVCPSRGSLPEALKRLNIEIKIIEMHRLKRFSILNVVKSILRIRKLIREKNIDLIHSNGSRACFYAGIAARLERIPLVWHVRIADSDGLLDRFLAGLSTQIIAISDAVNRRFGWMKNRESKVKTIYNGIDLARFNPSLSGEKIRKEFGLALQTPLVGTVGRLDWYKGHQYFLKAARKVVDNIPECCFLIVGDGEKRKELEELTKELNLNKSVIFTGNREDIPQILVSLDLFILSSVSEGFGRSAAEAMACAKPVVATKAGGLSEVVEDGVTGLLISPADPTALSKAIVIMLKNKDESQKMGLAGRRRAENLFEIKVHIKKIENLYIELLKKNEI